MAAEDDCSSQINPVDDEADDASHVLTKEVTSFRENLLKAMLENTPNLASLKDRQGRYVWVSQQFAREVGRNAADIIGKTPVDIHSKQFSSHVREQDQEVMRTGKPLIIEEDWPYRASSGVGRTQLTIRFPIFDEGNAVAGLGAMSLEITDRKRAEQALRENRDRLEELVEERTRDLRQARDEALQASRAKSVFLANISHELRTPLNSIIGFTGILKNGLAGPINPEQRIQLSMIYSSAKHLLQLINTILDLSKVDTDSHQVVCERFSLDVLIRELKTQVQRQAAAKELVLDMRCCIATVVYTDRAKLSQILLNLLDNAIKFTQAGAVILRCKQCGRNLHIVVSDTGVGLEPVHIKNIFDAFYQVETDKARIHHGSGLGLAICKQYVELLGGHIRVRSTPSKGTTFRFCLPGAIAVPL